MSVTKELIEQENLQLQMTAMLQVVFMAIGLAVLTFVLAFLFRKWQRAINYICSVKEHAIILIY